LHVAVGSILAASASGCLRARSIGHFGDAAFYHVQDHYRVRYASAESRSLMSHETWTLDNFTSNVEGRPVEPRAESWYWDDYDLSALGIPGGRRARRRVRMVRTPRVDLRFVHRQGAGEIWARSALLHEAWARQPLDALMRYSVEAIAAHHPGAPMLVPRIPPVSPGLRLVREGAAQIDGHPAYFMTFDERTRSRSGQWVEERFTVVGVRPSRPWVTRRNRAPMLLVFGLASRPAQHDGLLEDFERLVSRVDLAP
jgi:hypothetical protein